MPPMTPKSIEYELLKPAGAAAGPAPVRHPDPASTPCPTTGAPPACASAGASGFGCEMNAKNGTQNTVIPRALATGNAWLRTECKVKEVLIDDARARHGRRLLRRERPAQEQPADLVVVSGGGDRVGAAAPPLEEPPPPERPRQPPRLGGPEPQGHTYTGAVGLLRAGDLRRRRPRGLHLRSATTTTARRACGAGACSPTSSSACPTSSRTTSRRGRPPGAGPTRTSCAATTGAT